MFYTRDLKLEISRQNSPYSPVEWQKKVKTESKIHDFKLLFP